MTKSFSIAHLSDLHPIATDGGPRKEDRARGMNANLSCILTQPFVQEVDLVLVTGDVSDRGEVAAWNVLWSSIRQPGLDQLAGLQRLLDEHAGARASSSSFTTRRSEPQGPPPADCLSLVFVFDFLRRRVLV